MADKVDQGLCNTIIKLLNTFVASSPTDAEREASLSLLRKKVAQLPVNTSFDEVLAHHAKIIMLEKSGPTAVRQQAELSKLRTKVANFTFVTAELRDVKAALRTAEVRNRKLEREISQLSYLVPTTAQTPKAAAPKPAQSPPPPLQEDTAPKIPWTVSEHLFLLRQMTVDYGRPNAGNFHIPLYLRLAQRTCHRGLEFKCG